MANILVSACLLGINCRYKGDSRACDGVLKLAERHTIIPVCPEQLGGLPTPRDPSEQVGDKVLNNKGTDVTAQYGAGAEAALSIAEICNVKCAILKSRSPSCGSDVVYDGTFSGKLIPGEGVCTRLLRQNGIPVFSEEQLDQAEKYLR